MLNQIKSVVYVFLCSIDLLVLCLSANRFHWVLLFGHLFFGAENSESCLNQFSGKREVRVAGSISNLILGFEF
ncbi:hypothetical protein ABRZ58_22525 [Vibrio vulnificus]|uniref:hypothetical protein n=1 Tax=Vibrio vulnificus TaxID=672 RepID=UPI001023403D|nr:hypothetical protein [Vibrio vulnificus]RZP59850.1 hypothetical protein D8T45_19265 [Vibrio vulnificus]RZR07560.1 hypothetical protein D8T24_23005 [Vibrio vulnificus]